MRRVSPLVVLVTVLAGCQDNPVVPVFHGMSSTGAGSSPDAFYWLPPLPSSGSPGGDFNPDLYPRVVVCRVEADACVEVIAAFDRAAGTLVMDAVNEQYQAQWKTDRAAPGRYRIAVHATTAPGSVVLGAIDLLATEGGGFTTLDGTAVRNSGSMLPIKFGVVRTCEDCVETVVGPGGAILTLEGEAQLNIPAQDDRPEFTVSISRYVETDGGGPCLPLPHPQYEGCYRIVGEYVGMPGFTVTFDEGFEATLFMCLEADGLAIADELWPWKWDETDPASLKRLEPSEVPAVNFGCAELPQGTARAGGLGSILAATGRTLGPLVRLVRVGVAHAQSGGTLLQGYKLRDLSRAGWVHELAIAKTAGDGLTVPAGSSVTPTVRVTSKLVPASPVAGVPVRFVASDGTIVGTATTDADGYASTVWQQGMAKGVTSTLLAEAFNYRWTWVNDQVNRRWAPYAPVGGDTDLLEITPGSVTFTAATVKYDVTFLTPLGTVSSTSNIVVSPLPTVEVCTTYGVSGCTVIFTAEMRLQGGSYQASWSSPSSLQPGAWYRVRVRQDGALLADVPVTAVSGGTKTKEPFTFEAGRTVPIKVTLQ